MKQTNLANLPAELLFSIFEFLDSKVLIYVAQSCRRLNRLTLPVVMGRAGVRDPQKMCVVKLGREGHLDGLTPFVICFSLATMEKFYCILSDKRHWHDHDTPASQILDFTRNIRRVNQLISRISSITSVTLVIASWGSPWSFDRDVAQPFTDAILDMTRISIQKCCTSFQILHSHPATHPGSMQTPYKFVPVDGIQVRKLGRSFTRHLFPSIGDGDFLGNGWKYQKICKPNAIPRPISSIPALGRLTTLDISCDFLLVPPFSSWIFGVMRSSPLTSLTLSVPYFVTREEFRRYLLPNVIASAPKLQDIRLAFFKSYILVSMVEKLSFFPHLRKITFALVALTISLGPIPVKPLFKLPHLTSFTGSAHQAAYVFLRSNYYPNLQSVNIIIDCNDRPGYAGLARDFAGLDACFLSRNLTPCISVCIVNYGRPSDTWSANEALRNHFAKSLRTYVSCLTLDLPRFSVETTEGFFTQITSTVAWVEVFRGLKRLALTLVDTVSLKWRQEEITAAVHTEFPDIEISINVVDFSSAANNRSHYHWSKARDSWVRGTREIPTMPFYLPPNPASYICSHF